MITNDKIKLLILSSITGILVILFIKGSINPTNIKNKFINQLNKYTNELNSYSYSYNEYEILNDNTINFIQDINTDSTTNSLKDFNREEKIEVLQPALNLSESITEFIYDLSNTVKYRIGNVNVITCFNGIEVLKTSDNVLEWLYGDN